MKEKNQFIQFLRGVSIFAVVLLHCLGKTGNAPLIIKPWLYFCVMMFVFLSGYLTPREKVKNPWKFWRKRLVKILIPYAIWSAIYLIIDGNLTPYMFVRALIRGNASGQLYFLNDYAQLVILTPLIYWMLEKKVLRVLLYAVTPCQIILNYYLKMHGKYLLVPLCGWLLMAYLLGLEHEKWEKRISNVKMPFVICAIVICGFAETWESFVWRIVGIEALTNTQVKFTTLLFTLSILLFLGCLRTKQKEKLAQIRFFTRLGDLSFGIYCCHKIFLEFFAIYIPKGMPNALLLFPITLFFSAILVLICNKLLPKRICGWIGFV